MVWTDPKLFKKSPARWSHQVEDRIKVIHITDNLPAKSKTTPFTNKRKKDYTLVTASGVASIDNSLK